MALGRRNKARLIRWTFIFLAALLVEAIARLGLVRPATLIPVTEMLGRLWEILVTGTIPSPYFMRAGTPSLVSHLSITFSQVGLSFILAVPVGLLLGVLLWRYDLIARILNPYLVSYYAIPIFALYPLFILMFGIGILPIVLIGFLFSVVVIIVTTTIGFRKVEGEVYPKVGRSLSLSRPQMFRWIYFPAAAPYLFTGLKLGFIYCLIGVIASEFIVSTRGLGHIIDRSYRNFETANMYAGILFVVILALGVNTLLIRLEERIYGRFER